MIVPMTRSALARPAPAGRAGAEAESADAPEVPLDAVAQAVEERIAAQLARPATPRDLALVAKQQAFDEQLQLLAESARETNALIDLAMAQAKKEDERLAKYIEQI
jgi:hypothetical protein